MVSPPTRWLFWFFAGATSLHAQVDHSLSGVEAYRARVSAFQLSASGRHSEALAVFERLIANEPRDGDLMMATAKSAQALGLFDRAIAAYRKALEVGFAYSPANAFASVPSVNREIARLYARMEKNAEALNWLERAVTEGDWQRSSFSGYENDPDFRSLRDDPQFRRIAGLAPSGSYSRDDRWAYDLAYYTEQARRLSVARHDARFWARFDSTVAEIRSSIPRLRDDDIVMRIRRLAVLLGDGHEMVYPARLDAIRLLPVDFYFFDDGLHIIRGVGAAESLTGRRVVAIGDKPAESLAVAMAGIIPADNPLGVLWDGAPQLSMIPVLTALGATSDTAGARVTVSTLDGRRETITMAATPREPASNKLMARSGGRPPLFLSRPSEFYWFTRIGEEKTMYFQFNDVLATRQESIEAFSVRFRDSLTASGTRNLIIDLRRNNGGNATLIDPLVAAITSFAVSSSSHRVFVLTSRGTASAAIVFLGRIAGLARPILAGEPTAAGPNFVGESWRFTLPFSQTNVSISYRYHQTTDWMDRRPWFVPAIPVSYRSTDYFSDRDPVLDAVLEIIRDSR